MFFRNCVLCVAGLIALFCAGCNNTLNPLCGSARPVPLIGSLAPSTVSLAQVQEGFVLAINHTVTHWLSICQRAGNPEERLNRNGRRSNSTTAV